MNYFAVHLKLALHCKLYIFQILFPYRLLQDSEYSSLCSRVLAVYLFLYTTVYMLIPNSYLSPAPSPTIPFGNPKFVFCAFLCLGICFCSVILSFFFTSRIWYHVIVVFLQLIWQSIYGAADGIISSLWFKNIPLYTCTTSLSVHLSVDI